MHDHIAGERHRKVIPEALLAQLRLQAERIAALKFLIADAFEVVAGVEHLEQELVALVAVLTQQRVQCLHGRRLNLLETIEGIHVADGIENIVSLCHLLGTEVAGALGD